MNNFTIEKNKLLIELVKDNPVLYDPRDPHFDNNIAKDVVWEHISSIMDISVPDIKRRWNYFRDHFHKKQITENAGHPTIHTTWYFYKRHLQFLDQFSTNKDKVKDNSKHTEEIEEFLDCCVEESVEDETDKDSIFVNRGTYADSIEDLNEPFLKVEATAEIEEFKTEQDKPDSIHCEMVLGSEPVPEDIPKKKRKNMDTLAAVLEKRLAKRFRLEMETSKSHHSPTHKFFESMADIVAQFPPHLVAETRLKVCHLVNEIELKNHNEQEFLFPNK